jgi:hypothetical protein
MPCQNPVLLVMDEVVHVEFPQQQSQRQSIYPQLSTTLRLEGSNSDGACGLVGLTRVP